MIASHDFMRSIIMNSSFDKEPISQSSIHSFTHGIIIHYRMGSNTSAMRSNSIEKKKDQEGKEEDTGQDVIFMFQVNDVLTVDSQGPGVEVPVGAVLTRRRCRQFHPHSVGRFFLFGAFGVRHVPSNKWKTIKTVVSWIASPCGADECKQNQSNQTKLN